MLRPAADQDWLKIGRGGHLGAGTGKRTVQFAVSFLRVCRLSLRLSETTAPGWSREKVVDSNTKLRRTACPLLSSAAYHPSGR